MSAPFLLADPIRGRLIDSHGDDLQLPRALLRFFFVHASTSFRRLLLILSIPFRDLRPIPPPRDER